MALERCPECKLLGGHLGGCSRAGGANAETPDRAQIMEARAAIIGRHLRVGGIWLAIGIVLLIGSYLMADRHGGFILFYGPIVYGGLRLLWALILTLDRPDV